jgi:hypothetical protein
VQCCFWFLIFNLAQKCHDPRLFILSHNADESELGNSNGPIAFVNSISDIEKSPVLRELRGVYDDLSGTDQGAASL